MSSHRHLNPQDQPANDPEQEGLRFLFHDLFISYETDLFKLALGFTKSTDMAKDIVHDVFLKLWEIRHQLHEIKSIESFLFTMTRNKIMDYLRKVSSDARMRQQIWQAMQGEPSTTSNKLEEKEFTAVLKEAINQLPPQRKAIYLLRDEGLEYTEIAAKLNISKHTVKNQLSAAFKAIRQAMNNFKLF